LLKINAEKKAMVAATIPERSVDIKELIMKESE
jgi:hypothetical protein